MRLIITGCEYSGTTTIANAICKWARDSWAAQIKPHDHFKIPHIACYPQGTVSTPLTREEREQILTLSPKLLEMLQRQSIVYHYPDPNRELDSVLVGFHIEDAVYAPIYFGYGLEDEPQGGARTKYARTTEKSLLSIVPEIVLVLVTASPNVIATRMRKNPHINSVLQKQDIKHVLQRFQEEYESSLFAPRKFTLDTSVSTVTQTLEEFKQKYQVLFSDHDRHRIVSHRALKNKK